MIRSSQSDTLSEKFGLMAHQASQKATEDLLANWSDCGKRRKRESWRAWVDCSWPNLPARANRFLNNSGSGLPKHQGAFSQYCPGLSPLNEFGGGTSLIH
jgi:hypothetical protein